jgi:hypothetical protein
MILWLDVNLHLCKANSAAGKRPGVTEHCLRGRPGKPRRLGNKSTRFNILNRSFGSIFFDHKDYTTEIQKIEYPRNSIRTENVDW